MAKHQPRYELCELCGQPMLPQGTVKLLNEYDHAQGCPNAKPVKPCNGCGSPSETGCACG